MKHPFKVLLSIFKPNRNWVRRLMICGEGPAWRIDCKTCRHYQGFHTDLKKHWWTDNGMCPGQTQTSCGLQQYRRDVGIVK